MRNSFIERMVKKVRNTVFPGSALYWKRHYLNNGNSGTGSYGESAAYKAHVLNEFVKENSIQSVIEFGCGDGNQTLQFDFPAYTGLDISEVVIEKCKSLFKEDPTKRFFISGEEPSASKAELAISLDVIYHLVENEIYETYMNRLFAAASKYVIIYAWDVEADKDYHVKHHKFTNWIKENISDFQLINKIKSLSFSDFYIYQKMSSQLEIG